jgi:quinol-cytochrome oxidoreductase complex cytochrome b subunit
MIVPMVRDEEDMEDLYIEDFFWLHERGVDLIFIFSYIHLLRKLYIYVIEFENSVAWKSGVFTFLIFNVVVFCGLVLCCTHLSEITLTIAANIFHTFFWFKTKAYWWFFTDKQLNTDTLIRLAYAHYLAGFYMFYLALIHGIEMHNDWKNEFVYDGNEAEMTWWDEALSSELFYYVVALLFFTFVCREWYGEPEALSYEIFMWGDIGIVTDVRFYGVAPHWYFRPFMAWLIACPFHRTGIFGLLFFFFVLFFQPNIHSNSEQNYYSKLNLTLLTFKFKKPFIFSPITLSTEFNLFYQITYALFVMCILYTTSSLPYGRFYNRVGGNVGMLFAYLFVFSYLGFTIFRRPIWFELTLIFFFLRTRFLSAL